MDLICKQCQEEFSPIDLDEKGFELLQCDKCTEGFKVKDGELMGIGVTFFDALAALASSGRALAKKLGVREFGQGLMIRFRERGFEIPTRCADCQAPYTVMVGIRQTQARFDCPNGHDGFLVYMDNDGILNIHLK